MGNLQSFEAKNYWTCCSIYIYVYGCIRYILLRVPFREAIPLDFETSFSEPPCAYCILRSRKVRSDNMEVERNTQTTRLDKLENKMLVEEANKLDFWCVYVLWRYPSSFC